MPATITSTGTFTSLSSVLNATRSNARGNESGVENLNFDSLKTMEGVRLDELRQFIQIVADAAGIRFQPAAVLVYHLLKAYIQGLGPLTLGDERGSRLFVP